MRLSPKLARRRIEIHIGDFFAWMAGFYADHGWAFGDWGPSGNGNAWDSRDLTIRLADIDANGRVRELVAEFRHLPSAIDHKNDAPVIGWSHEFAIVLPEQYPSDLRMRIVNLSPTMHPRMLPPEKEAPACIFPNGELDRVLREIVFNLLFKPDFVRPPVLFQGEDHGFRPREMKWYSEYGPEKLFRELMTAWDAEQRKLAGLPPKPPETGAKSSPNEKPQPAVKPKPPAPATPEPPKSGFRIRGAEPTEAAPSEPTPLGQSSAAESAEPKRIKIGGEKPGTGEKDPPFRIR